MVWTPSRRQMPVARGNCSPNMGVSPATLLLVEIPAVRALQGGGEGKALESGPVPAG